MNGGGPRVAGASLEREVFDFTTARTRAFWQREGFWSIFVVMRRASLPPPKPVGLRRGAEGAGDGILTWVDPARAPGAAVPREPSRAEVAGRALLHASLAA